MRWTGPRPATRVPRCIGGHGIGGHGIGPQDRATGSGHGIGSAPEVGDGPRPVVPLKEPVALGNRLRVGHDRRGRLVLGPQVAAERGEVGGIVRLGCRINSGATSCR